MRERIHHAVRRGKFAAAGAAIGGGLGGLVGRNAASTGAGIGALVGATVAEKFGSLDSVTAHVSSGEASE